MPRVVSSVSSFAQGSIAQSSLDSSNPCFGIAFLAGVVLGNAALPRIDDVRLSVADRTVRFWKASKFGLDLLLHVGVDLRSRIDAALPLLASEPLGPDDVKQALYCENVLSDPFAAASNGASISISDFNFTHQAYFNSTLSTEVNRTTLEQSLGNLEINCSGILTGGGYSMSITKFGDGSFVAFDSHSRNPEGQVDGNGVCLLSAHQSVSALVSHISSLRFLNITDGSSCFASFAGKAKAEIKLFGCPVCDSSFPTAAGLGQHCRAKEDHRLGDFKELLLRLGHRECSHCAHPFMQLGNHLRRCSQAPMSSSPHKIGRLGFITEEERKFFEQKLDFFEDCGKVHGFSRPLAGYPFMAHYPINFFPNAAKGYYFRALELLGPYLADSSHPRCRLAWKALLSLVALCLSVERGKDKKEEVVKRLSRFCKGEFSYLASNLPPDTRRAQTRFALNLDALAKRKAIEHAEARQFRQALRRLQQLKLCDMDDVVLDELKGKHPDRLCLEGFQCPMLPDDVEALSVGDDNLCDVFAKLPKLSAPGVYGWRYEFFRPLLANPRRFPSLPGVISFLTGAFNEVFAAKVPEEVGEWLTIAKLLPFAKEGGGIRPIAIGAGFRRLLSVLALKVSSDDFKEALGPKQFGVAIPNGVEFCVHKARIDLLHLRRFLLVFDITNAFNSVARDAMLKEVSIKIPYLLPFILLMYNEPSILLLSGGHTLLSKEGTQQGDPLAPALFSLALAPVMDRMVELFPALEDEINAYLDDITVSSDDVVCLIAEFIPAFEKALKEIGLALNIGKSCLIHPENKEVPSDVNLGELRVVKVDDGEGVRFLGSPLGAGLFVCKFLCNKIDEYKLLCASILSLSNNKRAKYAKEICFDLIVACVACKFNFLLRSTPIPPEYDFLTDLDKMLIESVGDLLDDSENYLANNPLSRFIFFSKGGTGIHKPSSTAPCAYASSLASSCLLASSLGYRDHPLGCVRSSCMPAEGESSPFACIANAFRFLYKDAEGVSPDDEWEIPQNWKDISQHQLCLLVEEHSLAEFLKLDCLSKADKAHLLSLGGPKANMWRMFSYGVHLNNLELKVFLRRRFRMPIRYDNRSLPNTCPFCAKSLDLLGDHLFSCANERKIHFGPHNVVRDCLYVLAKKAGCSLVTKETCLYQEDNKKGDVYIGSGMSGGPYSIDVATSNPTCASYIVKKSDTVPLAAANFRAKEKHKKYVLDSNNFKFVCFSMESSGAMNEEAVTMISQLHTVARESREKFQFGDLASRFIARSFARASAFALLECIRNILGPKHCSITSSEASSSVSPVSSPVSSRLVSPVRAVVPVVVAQPSPPPLADKVVSLLPSTSSLCCDRQHTHDDSMLSSDEELFVGAGGGIDGELARGYQGEFGLVNGSVVDADNEGKSVVMEYRSDDESVEASESECDDVADDESVDTSGSDDEGSAGEDEVFWSEQESVDASVFDDKNIAGMGEEFWSGEGSVDVSEADDENIVEVVEERYGSEKESVVASISDCDVVELAIAPMIDCDNIGIVDSKKIIFTRSQGRVQL